VQQQNSLRQQQLIAAGQSSITQPPQPQPVPQRELVITGTASGIVQSPQQLQTTAAPGTWIPQQSENTVPGTSTETLLGGKELKVLSCYRKYLLLMSGIVLGITTNVW
jgi:hypothetical protein